MSGKTSTFQTVNFLFIMIVTFTSISLLCGSIISFISSIYEHSAYIREYRPLQQRLPQCIIVGAMKSGTKALIVFLGMHPKIKINSKDVDFFNKDENFSKGLDYYRSHMPVSYPGDITIEKSPAYFASEDARQRIRLYNMDIKLIVILRNPIDRAMSHFLQLKRKKMINVDRFEDYVIDFTNGNINVNGTPIIEPSLYVEHLNQWLWFFPRSQIHVVDGDAFAHNPVPELRKVETFLGLKHWITDQDFYFDSDKGFYCMQIAQDNVNCLKSNKGNKHPDIDPLVLSKLKEFFQPYNEKLFSLLGQRFDWE